MEHNLPPADVATRYGTGRKTLKSYLTGLVLCFILTALSFILVKNHLLNTENTYIALSILAILQLMVQVICFLRLNATREGMWNSLSFLFALFIVAILMAGTLWIMYNLNYNMSH